MRKTQYLSFIIWEKNVLKSGKTEKQELPGKLPSTGNLFPMHIYIYMETLKAALKFSLGSHIA